MGEGRSWRMEIGSIPDAAIRGNSRLDPRYRGKVKTKWHLSGIDHALVDMRDRYDPPFEKLRITFTWHHWKKIDLDNLAIGMKPWIDGLVEGINRGFDDDPGHVEYGIHQFVKQRHKGDSKTEVLIEEIG